MKGNGKAGHTVSIALPIYESVNVKSFMCFLLLQNHLDSVPIPGVRQYGFRTWSQSGISMARHGLLVKAFQEGATHIMWIDADMIFPHDTVHRLMAHDLPVVGANCVRRQEPYTWTAQDVDGNEVSSVGKTGLEEVGYLGFGVTLMRMDCFTKIDPPFFNFEWVQDNPQTMAGHYMGEDIYLFDKLASKTGIRPVVDHDLSRQIKHVGRLEVGYDWAAGWREANPEAVVGDPAVRAAEH